MTSPHTDLWRGSLRSKLRCEIVTLSVLVEDADEKQIVTNNDDEFIHHFLTNCLLNFDEGPRTVRTFESEGHERNVRAKKRNVEFVVLVKSFPPNSSSLRSGSIQPRTDRSKLEIEKRVSKGRMTF